MRAERETGGPAFPTDNEHQNGPNTMHFEGMSLRDYFAAKAMQALNAGATCHDVKTSLDYVAETAYQMADAMLKARESMRAFLHWLLVVVTGMGDELETPQ